jgi:hypothetical protein
MICANNPDEPMDPSSLLCLVSTFAEGRALPRIRPREKKRLTWEEGEEYDSFLDIFDRAYAYKEFAGGPPRGSRNYLTFIPRTE